MRTAQTAIVIAGCLGTAFLQIVTSAAAVQYTRALGGTGLHVGILNALPTGMLFMQLLAGLAASRLTHRKPLWFCLTMLQRVLPAVFAIAIWTVPGFSDGAWVWMYLGMSVALHGLGQFGHPLWMSWMGDYLPRQGLSSYWGKRQAWMNWTIAASLLVCAVYVFYSPFGIRDSFAHLSILASVCGVIDLVLHLRVDEPEVVFAKQTSFQQIFVEPFRHAGFRSFIGYACMWHLAAMIGAPFISLYLLQHIGMTLFQVLLLWSVSATGGALFAGPLGRFAEKHGNKPLLVFCTLFKPINMLSLLFCPRDPEVAFMVLVPAFMFDALLNVGIQIGQDGFLIKQSPARNRAMFIASGMAMAGLVGCATSVACGAFLTSVKGVVIPVGGYMMNGFHTLFWLSALMRFVILRWVVRIEEPAAADHRLIALRVIHYSMSRMTLRVSRIAPTPAPTHLATSSPPADRAA
jgi:hypothetical protein